ncbi:hypothetical protein BC938DRAFT_479538 [Jimgerdemannia flammicorona]|uniref:Uncharacterized protein n=1 Tax=Jimgerdemannia flammicorona TaxID=994334 RepID=A0A433QKP1_9FUNG|nr:hypothetical protein BC938DRAFT_479538 [Jimgerdemannia flammicorona]
MTAVLRRTTWFQIALYLSDHIIFRACELIMIDSDTTSVFLPIHNLGAMVVGKGELFVLYLNSFLNLTMMPNYRLVFKTTPWFHTFVSE